MSRDDNPNMRGYACLFVGAAFVGVVMALVLTQGPRLPSCQELGGINVKIAGGGYQCIEAKIIKREARAAITKAKAQP